MKRYRGIIPRRKLNPISAALGANVLNIVMILILRGIWSLLPKTGYNLPYGIVELAAIVIFWFVYSYRAFSTSTEDNHKIFLKYIVLTMLPMIVYTAIACIVVVATRDSVSFMRMWNGLTFGIAPALFLYLPYGLIYHFLPDSTSILVFFVIALIIMIGVQGIGYVVGKRKLTTDEAKERKRKALEDKLVAEEKEAAAEPEKTPQVQPTPNPAANTTMMRKRRQKGQNAAKAEKAIQREQEREARKAEERKARQAKQAKKDPLGDVENKAIIETEAFTPITDEMIEEVMREERKKQRAEAQQTKRASASKTRHSKRESDSSDDDDTVGSN